MANEVSEAQRRRSQARDARRAARPKADDAASSSHDEQREDGQAKGGESHGARDAARAAAAAAAVGAAVGAVKAITDRSRDHRDGDEAEDQDAQRRDAATEARDGEREAAEDAAGELEPSSGPTDEDDEMQDAGWGSPPDENVRGAKQEDIAAVLAAAREGLIALRGAEAESVSSLERTPDGWHVALEVVEVSRVPDSTDVLASYEVDLDDDKNLRACRRVRRYYRAQADEGGYE